MEERDARWQECLSFVESSMGFVLGNAYMDRRFSDQKEIDYMKQLNKDIRQAFRARLNDLTWLDQAARNKTLYKVLKNSF